MDKIKTAFYSKKGMKNINNHKTHALLFWKILVVFNFIITIAIGIFAFYAANHYAHEVARRDIRREKTINHLRAQIKCNDDKNEKSCLKIEYYKQDLLCLASFKNDCSELTNLVNELKSEGKITHSDELIYWFKNAKI